jgi:SAM domain (Sterile alpha motif)
MGQVDQKLPKPMDTAFPQQHHWMRAVQDTTMDVAVWLRGLGLQQYEAQFRKNDIDAEVLSDLTDPDLEKIGVSLGHRKRLLKAIAALAGLAAAPRAGATPIPPVAAAAERRQLTVRHCHIRQDEAPSPRLANLLSH